MTKILTAVLSCWLLCSISLQAEADTSFRAEASLVEIEVTKTTYDYKIPWVIRNSQTRKNGIILGERQILTTADGLSGHTLCRIRKGGVSKQYIATPLWIDYYSNLAVLTVDDAAFWSDLQPVQLVKTLPQSGNLQIYRWRSGRIESRAAEIIRLYVGSSKTSYIQHLKLAASSEIDAAGWAEVVIHAGRLIGLTTAAANKKLTILPAPFILSVLERKTLPEDPGAGCFDFRWMSAKNPALVQSKGFDRSERGVVITEVGSRRLADNTLQPGDILFAIDGFAIDDEGKYIDPAYGRLSINGLATRAHAAGDVIPMQVWRDGRERLLDYHLPRADFDKSFIPEQHYDQAPCYLIAESGLSTPDGPYCAPWATIGRCTCFYDASATMERNGLVLLTMVLPDDVNRSYEGADCCSSTKSTGTRSAT